MKVVVLGAGVVGVTTAWYLAKAGADVTVIDRQRGPGMETSYANAGELSYGMTSPWAAPGVPKKALQWLFMKRRPLFIWPLVSPTMWAWGARMLRNCNEAAYRRNKARMVRISNYSRDCLPGLVAETGIEFDMRERGTLQLSAQPGSRRPRSRIRRCWPSSARPSRSSTATAASPPSRRWRRCERSSWAACA
jgi:D-amino-acid dehydrogenase